MKHRQIKEPEPQKRETYAPIHIPGRPIHMFSTDKADYIVEQEMVHQPLTGGFMIDQRLKRLEKTN